MGLRFGLAKHVARISLGLVLFMQVGESMAQADQWIAQRSANFGAWQAGSEQVSEQIDELKGRTQALIARHDAQQDTQRDERDQQWLAQSRGITDEQRRLITAQLSEAADLAKADRCQEAASLYREVLEREHLNHSARFGLGQCHTKLGDGAEAARHFTEIITLPFADPQARMLRTFAMLSMQKLPPPADPRINEPAIIFAGQDAPVEVWDAPFAPVMTIVPAGEFTMGSPETERFRLYGEDRHRVRIAYPLAFSKYNVTRGEFAAFVAETDHEAKGCNLDGPDGMHFDPDGDWRAPGFEQDDDHPVVCINFHDATAYAHWLSERTGQTYRLPSEAEWEHAIRGGTSTPYYWGETAGIGNANCDGCDGEPGLRRTTPGGAYPPNPFGLYDMAGNVWKWLADCWNASYDGAPTDGSAWMSGNCALRARRSGSWFNVEEPIEGDPREPGRLRSASRFGSIPSLRYSSFGFRVVRGL
ncbi:MAG: SUMF1/EgtB/PvdO family nonheme iron enzyme [Sphingomonadaceae bacterium]|nr:SUMF1/EgtB/PvdO family nonheme iron enzyme [Sphingomonadaceae bacterium]